MYVKSFKLVANVTLKEFLPHPLDYGNLFRKSKGFRYGSYGTV